MADEKIATSEGNAGRPQEQSPLESMPAEELPDSVFDERQKRIGERRKEAGPPLEQSGLEILTADEIDVLDVPETEPDETPEGGGAR